MSSSWGERMKISIFGGSHTEAIGVNIEGLPAGEAIDWQEVLAQMARRAPGQDPTATTRKEADQPRILCGLLEGVTTGAPLCAIIENSNQRPKDYSQLKVLPRPGHADYTAFVKYQGWQDYRGGGHFSGRLTAPLVAAGAICRQILAGHGIVIGSHLASCGGVADAPLPEQPTELLAALNRLNELDFAVLDEAQGQAMQQAILAAKAQADSVGGVLETAVCGMPAGIGEPFFNSVESVLAHLLFSVPAVKGVEFGAGFALAGWRGSQANDPMRVDEAGRIYTSSNHNGGINGGISNGMPIVFRTAIKPTPSIYQPQQTVDFAAKANAELQIQGRHDPAIVHRARVVVDAVTAIGLLDLFCEAYGTNWQINNEEN